MSAVPSTAYYLPDLFDRLNELDRQRQQGPWGMGTDWERVNSELAGFTVPDEDLPDPFWLDVTPGTRTGASGSPSSTPLADWWIDFTEPFTPILPDTFDGNNTTDAGRYSGSGQPPKQGGKTGWLLLLAGVFVAAYAWRSFK